MKTILYTNNNFQSLLCLEAVKSYLEQDNPKTHSSAFDGLIALKRNSRSITATYLNGKSNIMNFSKPIKEEDKNQLKLNL